MAITDLQISDTLETSAPSIKYEGNEGPKSPEEQQQMMMAQLEQEYSKYVFEMEEQGLEPMSLQQFIQQAMSEGQMSSAQPMPNRQMAAYGGIMDVGGRRRYGWGSKLKKKIRNLIPNEVAQVASVAAPFVAPFNPLIGGAMAGLGGFDRTGSIGKSLKSGLMTYGGGQLARGIGGGMGNLQGASLRTMPGQTGFGSYFSSPMQSSGGLGKVLSDKAAKTGLENKALAEYELGSADALPSNLGDYGQSLDHMIKQGTSGIMKFIDDNAKYILLGSMGIAGATATPQDMQEAARMARGKGIDIDGIRARVQEALAGGEETWNKLKEEFPYIGEFPTKKAAEGGRIGYDDGGEAGMVEGTLNKINQRALATARAAKEAGIILTAAQEQMIQQAEEQGLAYGGRIGLYAGGQSIPSDYTIEDAIMATTQDKMGGITDVMKQSDLYRQGSVGQMYAAHGGRIGAQEGGLMDLGGMEKDYRNDGGFVPIGGEEKADDVPARLSKNEFVFTADAVRGAGGGAIDKGAEIMENIMKN